jgi:hypothetical protein
VRKLNFLKRKEAGKEKWENKKTGKIRNFTGPNIIEGVFPYEVVHTSVQIAKAEKLGFPVLFYCSYVGVDRRK